MTNSTVLGRPFVNLMLSDRCPILSCPVCLPICLSVTLVYCGQTVKWIKMKLGMQVGVGPSHIVLDGNPAPLPLKGHSPQFWPMSFVDKRLDGSRWHLAWRWASVQATLCLMGTQLSSPKRGQSPKFSAMSIVAKRLDGSR